MMMAPSVETARPLFFHDWLESALDALGLDGQLYARCIASILKQAAQDKPELEIDDDLPSSPLSEDFPLVSFGTPPSHHQTTIDSGAGSDSADDEGSYKATTTKRCQRLALLECLHTVDVDSKQLNQFVSEILDRYALEAQPLLPLGSAAKKPNDSIDSGVCPSPAEIFQNYDQAFPPLHDTELDTWWGLPGADGDGAGACFHPLLYSTTDNNGDDQDNSQQQQRRQQLIFAATKSNNNNPWTSDSRTISPGRSVRSPSSPLAPTIQDRSPPSEQNKQASMRCSSAALPFVRFAPTKKSNPMSVPSTPAAHSLVRRSAPFTIEWTLRSAELSEPPPMPFAPFEHRPPTSASTGSGTTTTAPQFVVHRCLNRPTPTQPLSMPAQLERNLLMSPSALVFTPPSVGDGVAAQCPFCCPSAVSLKAAELCPLHRYYNTMDGPTLINAYGDTTLFDAPRFMLHHVAEDQITKPCLGYGAKKRRIRFPSAHSFIAADAPAMRGRRVVSDVTSQRFSDGTDDAERTADVGSSAAASRLSSVTAPTDFMDSVDMQALQMFYQQQYDAERLVPSPIGGNDPSEFCAPKVYQQHQPITPTLPPILPVSPTTHFVPISVDNTDGEQDDSVAPSNICVDIASSPPQFQFNPLFSPTTPGQWSKLRRPNPVKRCAANDLHHHHPNTSSPINNSNVVPSSVSSAFSGVWSGGGRARMGTTMDETVVSQLTQFTHALSNAIDDTTDSIWKPTRTNDWPPEAPWRCPLSSTEAAESEEVFSASAGDGMTTSTSFDSMTALPRTSIADSLTEDEDDENFLRYVGNIALRSPLEKQLP